MKTPPKPFIVEVKRSRSNSPAADPLWPQPPVLVEATAPDAPPSHSKARQLAEQAFKALAVAPVSQPPDTMERVFRARTVSEVFVEVPEQTTQPEPEELTWTAQAAIPPKRGRPVGTKKPIPKPPGEKKKRQVALSDAFGVEAAALVDIARQNRDQSSKPVETMTGAAPAWEGTSKLDPSEADQKDAGANWGWGPGERWKRRLRHLR